MHPCIFKGLYSLKIWTLSVSRCASVSFYHPLFGCVFVLCSGQVGFNVLLLRGCGKGQNKIPTKYCKTQNVTAVSKSANAFENSAQNLFHLENKTCKPLGRKKKYLVPCLYAHRSRMSLRCTWSGVSERRKADSFHFSILLNAVLENVHSGPASPAQKGSLFHLNLFNSTALVSSINLRQNTKQTCFPVQPELESLGSISVILLQDPLSLSDGLKREHSATSQLKVQ